MKTYKLLKDLPLAKAGTEVTCESTASEYPIYSIKKMIDGTFISSIVDDDRKEWLEEIPEKQKTVYDFVGGEDMYTIGLTNEVKVIKTIYAGGSYNNNLIKLGLAFATEQEAKNAIIRMETANRKDKFVPGIGKRYYILSEEEKIDPCKSIDHPYDRLCIDHGLAFRTEEECEAYMTDEVKRAFGYIS